MMELGYAAYQPEPLSEVKLLDLIKTSSIAICHVRTRLKHRPARRTRFEIVSWERPCSKRDQLPRSISGSSRADRLVLPRAHLLAREGILWQLRTYGTRL
jgi:hypothetical protein